MASSSCSKFEPAATKYKFIPITTLLNHRQMGFSRSRFKNQFIRSTENSTADMGILCSLYCDANAYLEVIACRKVPRAQAAAFFHGRLFVENYQSWYNLCTSPTSGPVLMTENIFAGSRGGTSSAAAPATASQSSQSRLTQTPEGKVIDAVCVDHPYDCKAPPDRMWYGAQLFLLTKTGCLYQADIETARILDQIHLPTKQYEDQLFDVSEKLSSDVESSLRDIEIRKPPKFNYNYIAVNRENESVIIKSSRHHNSHASLSSTAYCVLKLYPLSVHCHFTVEVATACTTPPFSADVIEDFFVVTANKQSKISFYSLEDVIGEYGFSRHVRLKEKVKVFYSREWPHFTEAVVGAKQLGVPYTLRPVRLDRVTQRCRLLFKTVAVKHSLQIGSSPYHYMVAMNRNGTAWGLRHIADQADAHAVKLQVAEKWDGSQWNGVRFHNDDTGRIFKQDSNSLEVFSVVNNPPSSADMPGDGKSGARHNSLVSLRSDFKIDITPPCGDLFAQLDDDSGGGAQKWECSVPRESRVNVEVNREFYPFNECRLLLDF